MALLNLFTPIKVGQYRLANRIVLAPMTRSRAASGNVPTPLMATYYAQRAGAGLMITEATQIAPEGIGYVDTPGIHSPDQINGWKLVTNAVHQAGGRIFLQLWHVGRISHSLFQPDGKAPIAPSAIAPKGNVFTPQGMKPFETPRALELSEIPNLVTQFRQGAVHALAAGFDGVEIHAANGYLIDQFLRDGSNNRTDGYGGSVENRARFLIEVAEAVIDVWGEDRVGVRLAPGGAFNDMSDSDSSETFSYAVSALDDLAIAYLHVKETTQDDIRHGSVVVPTALLRERFQGALMVNGGYTRERADQMIENGGADLVAFGVPFLANPDLPQRLAQGAPLNPPDPTTFYGGGEKGYTDYPVLATVS